MRLISTVSVTRARYLPHIVNRSVGRLYRGLVPPLLLEAPKRAVKLYVVPAVFPMAGSELTGSRIIGRGQ